MTVVNASKMAVRNCIICGTSFKPIRSNACYCGKACQRKRERVIPVKTYLPVRDQDCASCGVTFQATFIRHVYCSKTCRNRAGWVREINGETDVRQVKGWDFSGYREDMPRHSTAPPLTSCARCRGYGIHQTWCGVEA